MDDLSFLVQETMRLTDLRQAGVHGEDLEDGEEFWTPVEAAPPQTRAAPEAPGVLFHLEHQGGTFIVRTMPSRNLAKSVALIAASPEDFPTLRLIQAEQLQLHLLKWFACETPEEAEVVHARLGHRRFPMREEEVCNLSDPGFSWWLEAQSGSFVAHTKMGKLRENLVRLGPIADPQIAPHRWNELATLLSHLPLALNVSNETSRLTMTAEPKDRWVVDEFCRVFLEGKMSSDLTDLFRLLGRRGVPTGLLETSWFFLKEMSVVRRFWIDIEELLS
jgi:hypothetical protein